MGRNNIGRGVSPEKYDLRSTIYEVSKATATAQDTHTYKLAVEPNSYFVIHTSHFPSPLVGRNNIGRGVSPCSWSKTYPSPMSVATRPTDDHSVGRKPGAVCGSGLTPLVGIVSASSRRSSGSILFFRSAGVARALRARLTTCLCYFAPQGGLGVGNVKSKIRSKQSYCDGARYPHLQIGG